MPEHTGTERPGGRTARTRRAVLDAARAILSEGDELSIPAVAARSGVHATTIYRRWRTIESIALAIAVEDVNAQSPIPVTGNLEADLTAYVRHLLTSIRTKGHAGFFHVLLSAARHETAAGEVAELVQPRLSQFQALLDAARISQIDALRLVEIIIAPAYFWAQLGAPLDPERDTDRLVETALLACHGASLRPADRPATTPAGRRKI